MYIRVGITTSMNSFGQFAETELKKTNNMYRSISLKFKRMGTQCWWLKGLLATKYLECILLRTHGFKIRMLWVQQTALLCKVIRRTHFCQASFPCYTHKDAIGETLLLKQVWTICFTYRKSWLLLYWEWAVGKLERNLMRPIIYFYWDSPETWFCHVCDCTLLGAIGRRWKNTNSCTLKALNYAKTPDSYQLQMWTTAVAQTDPMKQCIFVTTKHALYVGSIQRKAPTKAKPKLKDMEKSASRVPQSNGSKLIFSRRHESPTMMVS